MPFSAFISTGYTITITITIVIKSSIVSFADATSEQTMRQIYCCYSHKQSTVDGCD